MAGKRAMEMSADETRKFVELYIAHECLWNPLSPIYSRRDFRLSATRRVISEMGNGMTEEQVAKKIACLRTCYARELKKLMDLQEKAKLNDDYEFTYKPRWQFFEMLDPYLRPSVLQNSSYFHNMDGTVKDDSSPENKVDNKEKEATVHERISGDSEVNGTAVHVNSTCLENTQNSGLTTENDIMCDVSHTYFTNFQKPTESNEVPSCSGEYEYDAAVTNTQHFSSIADVTNTVTSPGPTSTHQNGKGETNGIRVRTNDTRCNTTKHKGYHHASSEKNSASSARILETRKRKADNLESTMLGVLTRLEKKISTRATENNVGTSLKPNSDELFSQHLANLMQKVPESKAKWEMQLKLQQTILDYIPD